MQLDSQTLDVPKQLAKLDLRDYNQCEKVET